MNQLKLATFRKHCRLNSQPVPKVVFSYNYWRNYEVGNNATNGNLSGIQNLKLQSKGRHFFYHFINPIQGGGGPNQPPLSRICVNACGYEYTGANFLWLFLIFSMEEVTRLSTQ